MSAQRLRVVIKGRVQGVGFRHFAIEHAGRLGLTGWVRNVPNGDVEVVAEGEEHLLDQFLVALKQGPLGAVIQDVTAVRLAAKGEFKQFGVRW
jgi:acylphosphatase